jgi:ABC-type antimicrobial peptide transport system ATPase subunit
VDYVRRSVTFLNPVVWSHKFRDASFAEKYSPKSNPFDLLFHISPTHPTKKYQLFKMVKPIGIECKSTEGKSMGFDRVNEKQVEELQNIKKAGEGIILVEFVGEEEVKGKVKIKRDVFKFDVDEFLAFKKKLKRKVKGKVVSKKSFSVKDCFDNHIERVKIIKHEWQENGKKRWAKVLDLRFEA